MRPIHLCWIALLCACTASVARTPPAAPVSPEEKVVQAQVDAFNRGDIDGFMAAYAPGAIHWEFPDDTVFAGAERIRRHYAELFAEVPDVHAEVRKRIVKGRFVIDDEFVRGLPGDDPHVTVVIYEVVDGCILNVWSMN